jgi:hypothetical protein
LNNVGKRESKYTDDTEQEKEKEKEKEEENSEKDKAVNSDDDEALAEDMKQEYERLKAKTKRKMIDLKRIALTRLENYNKIEGNKIIFAEGLGRTQRSDFHNTVVLKQRITQGYWSLFEYFFY